MKPLDPVPLKIKCRHLYHWMQYEISGFTPRELDELKSMDIRDATDKVLEMLDDRNDGKGTYLKHCVGIHYVQFGMDSVLIKANV